MGTITCNGEYDHLFRDDRDPRIENMDPAKRLPPYGSGGLERPYRSLTAEEVELINRIGMPRQPDERD